MSMTFAAMVYKLATISTFSMSTASLVADKIRVITAMQILPATFIVMASRL